MPDELERQRAAFGETLAREAREPVAPGSAELEPVRRPGRRWAVLGAAACVIAAIVGIAVLVGRPRADDTAAPPATSGPASIEEHWDSVAPAPDVPFDALRLDGTDWTVRDRAVHPDAVIDVTGCGEQGEYAALVGHAVVSDGYERPGLPWMRVSYVQYASAADGAERLLSAIDLTRCDGFESDTYERLDLGDHDGVWAEGHRMGDSLRLGFVGPDGVGVLLHVANDASDATLTDLVGRSVAFLQGQRDALDPARTATQLDDLLAVADDPLGLVAEGWSPWWWRVGPFETSSWPVCGPPPAVEAAAGAPTLDLSYRSPSDGESIGIRLLFEPDPGRRAEIGAAITAPPGCAPESLQPGEADAPTVDRGGEGVWGRGDTYAVAPRGEGALPLVAVVDAAVVDRMLAFLAPRELAVPADPLGLERDGWALVQRTTDPFDISAAELACPAAAGLDGFAGTEQVHDILSPPDSGALDLDVQVLRVGSLERGNGLAAAVLAIGDCIAESQGIEVRATGLSSIRASWFRAGPDFALVTIVGEGELAIVLEIEGDLFDDELLGSLAHRADEFLRTGEPGSAPEPIAPPAAGDLVVEPGGSVGEEQREPAAGELKLWVSNQSFDDDPVAITVTIDGAVVLRESFAVGSQHDWSSWFVRGLQPGEHSVVATSDTGVTREFTFTMPDGEPQWAVLDYWTDGGRGFSFSASDEPIYFA